MKNIKLYNEISLLSESSKKEVKVFLQNIKTKKKAKHQQRERKFGFAKGLLKMNDNFDNPIDDFKDYMN